MSDANGTDAIVIGAGHNGLVAACLLAKGGLKVTVVERRGIVGGACVTEELIPGYRVSTAAYSMGLLRPEVVDALDLHRHGLSYYKKDPAMFVPLPDGRSFIEYRDTARTVDELRRIHPADADAYPRYDAFWEDVARVIRPLILDADPPTLAQLEAELDRRGKADLFRLAIVASAEETVSAFFESDEIRGAFASQGMIGTFAGPRDPGTAFVMTYHAFGGDLVDSTGAWAYVRGGMGGITQALARAAEELGVDVRTDAPVARILADGRIEGVTLEDGTELHAPVVLSNAEAKRTLGLLPSGVAPAEWAAKVGANDTTGSVVKVNLALDELPNFTARPGTDPGPQHSSTIEISPSIDYLQAAFDDAKEGRVSARPFMEVFIQSVTDDSLAPPGKHVASCFAQWAPGSVPMAEWDGMREAAGDAVVDALAAFAPNLHDAISFRQVLGPPDLEARFGLTGGNIFHGELLPGQILGERLHPRTPVPGLYLCGSSVHPGGAVTGAPGWNAAHVVLADRTV